MQTHYLRTLFFVLALALAVLPASAAGNSLTDLTWQAGPETAAVGTQQADGGTWLFLPAAADLTHLALTFGGGEITLSHGDRSLVIRSGEPFDLTALFASPPDDGVWTVALARGRDGLTLHLMQSESLRSLYLTSADPAKDRTWVERSKDNKAKGSAVLLRADGSTVYAGGLKQIKGRGNSTWNYPKKPYQIKLADKADLLETGEAPESTWVLLANYCDETLLHNTLTYALAQDFGLAFPPTAPPWTYITTGNTGAAICSAKRPRWGRVGSKSTTWKGPSRRPTPMWIWTPWPPPRPRTPVATPISMSPA